MDPLKNWHHIRKNLDAFFGDEFLNNFEGIFQLHVFPQINLYETENELICLASIPGLDDINSVDVFIDHHSIELKGTIELRYKGFKQTKDEIYSGYFERKIDLPYPVRDDRIEATYQNGLLIFHLYRQYPDKEKNKIAIRKIED